MSTDDKPKPAQRFFTPVQIALAEEHLRDYARAERLDRSQHGEEVQGGDKQLPANQQTNFTSDADSAKKNFDQKIYLFPPSYNALRRELFEHWPTLFTAVNPATGVSLAYCMVYDAPAFIATLNEALDLVVQYDTDNVSGICLEFLNGLRAKRGLRPIAME